MKRILSWVFLAAFVSIGLLWPLIFRAGSGGGPIDDPVVLTNFRADFTVAADGRLDAVETIEGRFPPGRHGIFRYWDVSNANSPAVRQPPTITSILLDGEPVDYGTSAERGGRFRVAKIGDADTTLTPGLHTYEIRYTIAGALDPGDTGKNRRFASTQGNPDSTSVFFWNVIAPSWNNAIENVRVRATLPAPVTGAECSVGLGVGRACDGLTVSGNTVELGARNLAPHTAVTLRAGADMATPTRIELPWPQLWDRVMGTSVTGVFVVLGLTVLGGVGAALWARTTVESPPGFPVQYAPPPGLSPVQVEYIRTEVVPKYGLTATLFYLAERKLIELHQVSEQKWNVRGIAKPAAWADVDPVSVTVGSVLKVVGEGTEFRANKTVAAGKKLSKAKYDMGAATSEWSVDDGLMVKRFSELWIRAANVVAFILAMCAVFRWGFPATMWCLPFFAFFVFSVGSWKPGVGTRRTESGRQLWSQAGGFHRLLSTDSAETRFDFAARKDLYTAYIPFAIASGSAEQWAKKYRTSTGAVAPQPDWYSSTSTSVGWGLAGGSEASSFDSFESALSSSIGAYTASQSASSSSSSSSSGGGGSFGGGGGGGGSW